MSASYSLLVSLDKVQQLCDKFTGNPNLSNAGDVSNKLNDYIATIIHRNAVVNEYNTAIRQLLNLKTASLRLNAQYAKLGQNLATEGAIGLAEVDSFYRGLHARMRTECLRQTVAVARAASLFCLEDVPLPEGVSDPSGFSHADATSAASEINKTANDNLEAVRRVISAFPPPEPETVHEKGQKWYPPGVLVVLTPEAHPDIFKNLKNYGVAQFEIDLPTPSSTLPKSKDEPTLAAHGPDAKRTDSSTAHPFATRANVRLSRVRIFAEGLKDMPSIHLVHDGTERFVCQDGSVFPRSTGSVFANEKVLQHEPIVLSYQYTAKWYGFDPDYGFAANVVELGTTDYGDLQIKMKDVDYAYASIGPFAAWRLFLAAGADASLITRILIDFHGMSQELLPPNLA